MGDPSPTINISADGLEYAEQKFLKLFGKDQESRELVNWFKGLQQAALTQTANVHCLGMRNPVPFDSIYQPNRILVSPDDDQPVDAGSSFAYEDRVSRSILRGLNQKTITVDEFLMRDQDALIFGFPGLSGNLGLLSRSTKPARSSKSTTRNNARCSPKTISGSGATMSVHCGGTEQTQSSLTCSSSLIP
jgi:hypothetical protein